MEYVKEIFDVTYVPVDFEVIENTPDNENAILTSIQRNRVAIKVGNCYSKFIVLQIFFMFYPVIGMSRQKQLKK